jgi:hypothetical protein
MAQNRSARRDDNHLALPVIASEAQQSTVPLLPARQLGHPSSAPTQGPLKHLLHDQFWELVGGPSRGEMDCFATLAMTGSARGNGNARSTSTTSARVINFWASPYSASSPFF